MSRTVKLTAGKSILARQVRALLGSSWDGDHVGELMLVDKFAEVIEACGIKSFWPHPLEYRLTGGPKWRVKAPLSDADEQNIWFLTAQAWGAFFNAVIKKDGTGLRRLADVVEARERPVDPVRHALYTFVLEELRKLPENAKQLSLPTRKKIREILASRGVLVQDVRQFNSYLAELNDLKPLRLPICIAPGKSGRPTRQPK